MKLIEDPSSSAGSLSSVRLGAADLPGELVSAHADGRLVLFVGAGASVAVPSGLPTFRDLARRIADDSQRLYTEDDLEHADRLLGEIDGDVDVHLRVRDLIGGAESQPNELHGAIVGLTTASPTPRIVTTNYDRHLSTLLPSGIDEFEAPALPPGNDFRGLVYLHGSVRQDPRRLVVTKADFGRAYISDGWAAPFLGRLFGDLVTLFIGYGLNDTLMQYLAEALSEDAEMYALTDEPEDPRWHQHHVVPIGYGTHEHLPGLVRQWADNARMGMLDHDRRISAIVSGAPPLSPEDESYLDTAVAHPERVGLFTTHAHGVEWLPWISGRPQFKALFDPQDSFDRTTHCLKSWFADRCAANDDFAREALPLVPRNGGLVNRELWFSLVQSLSRPDRTRSEAVNRWIPLLVHTMPPGCNDWLGMVLRECELPRDTDLALLLFDRIFEPRMEVDRLHSGRMEIVAGTEESWLESVSLEWLQSNRAVLAQDLAPILDRHLRRFHLLTKMIGSSDAVWRLRGQGRIAIESRDQGGYDCGADVLIDMARDMLEALIADAPEVAGGYMRAWSEHEWALLRRLAVYGWIKRPDASADEKLRWLQESGLLLDRLLRPEVMRLLRDALPGASPDLVKTLISRVRGARDDIGRHVFDLLGWIAAHAPESSAASSAFTELRASHPDWRLLEDPDFPTWTALPAEDLMEPLELQGLHDRIQTDAGATVAGLINEMDERAGRGVDWTDARDALFATVVKHPADGVAVLEALLGEPNAAPGLERDLGETVLSGWIHARAIAPLTDERRTCVADSLPDIWRLGLRRWGDAKITIGDSGWLESAESHWAGMIAGLWLEAVTAEWRSAGDGWTGLPDVAKAALEEMIGGDTKASHFAQVVIAARIHLLFHADELWCSDHVLPMFDPSIDEPRAVRCWDGHLVRGRASEELLRAGLLDHFVAMASLLERLVRRRPKARSNYAGMAASVCVDSSIDPLEHGWLSTLVASADIETRVAWVQEMTLRMSRLSAGAADAHWSKWMRRYWRERLASIPVAITPQEASAMAEWSVLLGGSYPRAADLVLQSPGGLIFRSRLLYRLANPDEPSDGTARPDHLIEHPELTAQLLAHLLRNSEIPTTDPRLRHLPEVVARLDELLDGLRMEPIVNELLRLGFGEFVGWLQSQRDTANDPTPAASLS